jgi:hypothetical protein
MWNFLKSLHIWLECSSMLATKPTEREAFGCKALGKANCEDVDVVDKSEAIPLNRGSLAT